MTAAAMAAKLQAGAAPRPAARVRRRGREPHALAGGGDRRQPRRRRPGGARRPGALAAGRRWCTAGGRQGAARRSTRWRSSARRRSTRRSPACCCGSPRCCPAGSRTGRPTAGCRTRSPATRASSTRSARRGRRRSPAGSSENVAGLGGNVALGFLLGMSPVVAAFFGLPLDVRHVTLSTGSLAMAVSTLGAGTLLTAPVLARGGGDRGDRRAQPRRVVRAGAVGGDPVDRREARCRAGASTGRWLSRLLAAPRDFLLPPRST